jgi:hypothetical protein
MEDRELQFLKLLEQPLKTASREIKRGDKVIYNGGKHRVMNLRKNGNDFEYYLDGIKKWVKRGQIRYTG